MPLSKRWFVVCLAVATILVPLAAGAFAGGGILFGLDTTPNGDLVVADATVGILGLRNDEVVRTIALPGITDVSPTANSSFWAVTGAGGDPTQDTGQALHRVSNGNVEMVVNLFQFEATRNPVPPADLPDSNPFDVKAFHRGSALVVDAGGNDLLMVSRRGDVSVVAKFPSEGEAESVPTSVAVGPDNYLYVGELLGFVFPSGPPIGESNIWRVSARAHDTQCPSADCVKVFDGGFTSIIDMVFGPDGKLYVAEMDEAGWLAAETGAGVGGTINACDLSTLTSTEVATGIPQLTAIAFDGQGSLWATRNAIMFGQAEVFKVS